ncbi:MAG: outer membrane beta-barrel protein [Hyphomicrobiales bacterium]
MIKPVFVLPSLAVSFCTGVFAVSSAVIAADLPLPVQPFEPDMAYTEVPYEFPWDRYYIGLIAGFGYGSMDTSDLLASTSFFDNTFDLSGGLVGLTIGRNFQMYDNWVLGIELDGAFANIDGRKNGTSGEYIEADLNGILTARARLGYAMGEEKRFLPFVTAGFAAGHYEVGAFGGIPLDPDDLGNAVKKADWLGGYTLGAGLEYLVTHGISIKAEYLFMHFGGSITTDTIIDQATATPMQVQFEPDDVHLWRLGVNLTY